MQDHIWTNFVSGGGGQQKCKKKNKKQPGTKLLKANEVKLLKKNLCTSFQKFMIQ